MDDIGFEGRKHYPDYMAKPATERVSSSEEASRWLESRQDVIECKKLKARHSKATCLTLKKKALAGFSYSGESPSSADLMPCATCTLHGLDTLPINPPASEEDNPARRNSFVSSSFNQRCA
jgi:hypothetical protein